MAEARNAEIIVFALWISASDANLWCALTGFSI